MIVAEGDASRRDIVNRFIDDMRAYGEDWLGAECAERIEPDALAIA